MDGKEGIEQTPIKDVAPVRSFLEIFVGAVNCSFEIISIRPPTCLTFRSSSAASRPRANPLNHGISATQA